MTDSQIFISLFIVGVTVGVCTGALAVLVRSFRGRR